MKARTRAAQRNLRAGIKKMEKTMSPAAQVRRDFRLGRPPKAVDQITPLHPAVVWEKATVALSDLQGRMVAAKLNPAHVYAFIVYVEAAAMDTPRVLLVRDSEKDEALETLSRRDVLALGMLFRQFDEQAGQSAIFPHLFMPLDSRGVAVLRAAAEDRAIIAAFLMRSTN